MLNLGLDKDFWENKKVFITGHTGFKGSWLCLLLEHLNANIYGYSLSPPTNPSLFELADIDKLMYGHYIDDIRSSKLADALCEVNPDIIIHMAAQPLVLDSYKNSYETYDINVMGTVNLLESVKKNLDKLSNLKVIINVTTDKVYDDVNKIEFKYRESDALGGHDPYSTSKACSEFVTLSYYKSFLKSSDIRVATARAGNVIGGGDYAYRLVPNCIKSILYFNTEFSLKGEDSTRPWQFVLEPLRGYLMLAQSLYISGHDFCGGWNFGPDDDNIKSIRYITDELYKRWEKNTKVKNVEGPYPHEAKFLGLDSTKAKLLLGWKPIFTLDKTLDLIYDWYSLVERGLESRFICFKQIKEYLRGGDD